jgi:hypothetical protein
MALRRRHAWFETGSGSAGALLAMTQAYHGIQE